jgi:hypothetical protein
MLRVQQAGHWRPAVGAPLERGVMPQPTPSRKVHFPGYARRTGVRQTSCTAASNTIATALLKPKVGQPAPGQPAQRTGLATSPQTSTPLRDAFRPPRNTAALSPARCQRGGPDKHDGSKPRPDEPPGREELAEPSVPNSRRAAALPHQLSENPHSWLFWMFVSGGDTGPLF